LAVKWFVRDSPLWIALRSLSVEGDVGLCWSGAGQRLSVPPFAPEPIEAGGGSGRKYAIILPWKMIELLVRLAHAIQVSQTLRKLKGLLVRSEEKLGKAGPT
jgi:hypothetical protein